VVLFDRQVLHLDRLATDIRGKSGKLLNRAEIIRALIDGLLDSGMDITAAVSEADLRARVARRLGTPYRWRGGFYQFNEFVPYLSCTDVDGHRFTRRRHVDLRSDGMLSGRRRPFVTDQERQKADELISRLELGVGQIFQRDGGNASLLASMIQTLNGLRSLLGIVKPH
jgi:hypothetical protein